MGPSPLMIDLEHENLIPIRDVPRQIPPRRSGRRVHVSAVYRWIGRGLRGAKLEAIKIGGTTYTSLEALQRFGERLGANPVDRPSADVATPRARQREIEQAARAVEKELRITPATPEASPP